VVLDFVGGKNLFIPEEKAKKNDAGDICASKGLELMSLKSLTELDAVQDFVGDLGKLQLKAPIAEIKYL
jgi:hypothetical protein